MIETAGSGACLDSSHFQELQFHLFDLVQLPQPLPGSVSSPIRWASNLTKGGSGPWPGKEKRLLQRVVVRIK